MHNRLSLSLAALAVMALTATTNAQVVTSVQFTGNPSGSIATNGYTAGYIPETVWNTDSSPLSYFGSDTGGKSNLVDSTGATTSVSETLTSNGYYGPNGATTGFASAGDNSLFSAGPLVGYTAFSNPSTLTLTGLTASLTYDLFIYVRNDQGGTTGNVVNGTNSVNSQSFFLNAFGGNGTGYVISSATTAGSAVAGNTIEFTGLTGVSSLTASLSIPGNAGFTVSGFQLETLAAAPEPSTWALMLGGLGMLCFVVRRKRTAKI